MTVTSQVEISINNQKGEFSRLDGFLINVKECKGLVIFAHGSGSGSHSSRNQYLSEKLNDDGLSTLLVDLLTREEQETDIKTERILKELPGATLNKFNIHLLANRLATITKWSLKNEELKGKIIGYFFALLQISCQL